MLIPQKNTQIQRKYALTYAPFLRIMTPSKQAEMGAKMTKSELFKAAWSLAREGAKKFGGKVKEFFSKSLKLVYEDNKNEGQVKDIFEIIEGVITVVMCNTKYYTPWEREFVNSIWDRIMRYGRKTKVSEKQEAILRRIYAK